MIRAIAISVALVGLAGCANGPAYLTDSDYTWEKHQIEMTSEEMWRHMRREFRSCRDEVGYLDCIESADYKSFECDAGEHSPSVAYGRFYLEDQDQGATVAIGMSTKVPLRQQMRLEVFRDMVSGKTDVCQD